MIRKHFRFRRLVLGLAASLAIAVGAAPTVQAKPIGGSPVYQASTSQGIVSADVRDHRLIGQLVQAERGTSQSGFDWGDAGIGASVSFGATMFLLTAVGLGRRYRSQMDRTRLATS
jgi:hypothetical protein